MIKIDIVTTTRAEYGLMRPLIRRMSEDADIAVKLLVTGTHLSDKFGYTFAEIEKDGFCETEKIPILSDKSGTEFVSETMANAIVAFTGYLSKARPDFILVDGDRYETLGVCIAAANCNVPIIHCGGGETTEGAVDECFRHAITKMSYLHFSATEVYRNRIIQMGENPERVFTVGSMGIENILHTNFLTKDELEKHLGFSLKKTFAVATFHPVTLENNTSEQQLNELLAACEAYPEMQFIFTKANADNGGNEINILLEKYAQTHSNTICVSSLGAIRYLSALKYAEFVIGNSSSGITEAPSMLLPTINIGDRQRGRIQAESIINCEPQKEKILEAIEKALSPDFKAFCRTVKNPNGDGNTTRKIIQIVKDFQKKKVVDLKKKFYDIKFIC